MHTNLIQPKIIFTHDKTINLDNPKCAIFRKIRLFDLMMHSFHHLNNIGGRFFSFKCWRYSTKQFAVYFGLEAFITCKEFIFCSPQKREKIISRLFSEYSIYRHIFAFSLFLLWFYLNNLVLFSLSSFTVISLLLPLLLVIRMRFPKFYALVSGLLKYSLCFICIPRLLHFYTIQRHIFYRFWQRFFFFFLGTAQR